MNTVPVEEPVWPESALLKFDGDYYIGQYHPSPFVNLITNEYVEVHVRAVFWHQREMWARVNKPKYHMLWEVECDKWSAFLALFESITTVTHRNGWADLLIKMELLGFPSTVIHAELT